MPSSKVISLANLQLFKSNCDDAYEPRKNIPTPTTSNNGQVLGVTNGSFAFVNQSGGADNAVLYTSQSLTSTQTLQARNNIDAASSDISLRVGLSNTSTTAVVLGTGGNYREINTYGILPQSKGGTGASSLETAVTPIIEDYMSQHGSAAYTGTFEIPLLFTGTNNPMMDSITLTPQSSVFTTVGVTPVVGLPVSGIYELTTNNKRYKWTGTITNISGSTITITTEGCADLEIDSAISSNTTIVNIESNQTARLFFVSASLIPITASPTSQNLSFSTLSPEPNGTSIKISVGDNITNGYVIGQVTNVRADDTVDVTFNRRFTPYVVQLKTSGSYYTPDSSTTTLSVLTGAPDMTILRSPAGGYYTPSGNNTWARSNIVGNVCTIEQMTYSSNNQRFTLTSASFPLNAGSTKYQHNINIYNAQGDRFIFNYINATATPASSISGILSGLVGAGYNAKANCLAASGFLRFGASSQTNIVAVWADASTLHVGFVQDTSIAVEMQDMPYSISLLGTYTYNDMVVVI